MSLYGLFAGNGSSGFGYNSTTDDVTAGNDLSGKVYLLTGSSSGLGLETLRCLTHRGAHVLAAARTSDKAERAIAQVAIAGRATPIACELGDPASIRSAVAAVRATDRSLDGIIANAGIMALPRREVVHGVERQLFTNHVAHHLLIAPLIDQLTETGRVVVVSSMAHTMSYPEGIRFDDLDASKKYTAWGAYGQSKLANVLFAKALVRRLKSTQRSHAIHPGVIATNLGRHALGALTGALFKSVGGATFLKTIPQGAATQVYVATHPDAGPYNGEYWVDCNVADAHPRAEDEQLAEKLWDRTEALVEKL